MANIIDISTDQGTIDAAAIRQSGQVAGIVAKATEGLTYTDDQFRRNRAVAFKRKIPLGAYHFYRAGDDGGLQAAFFVSVAKPYGALRPMIDVEEASFDGVTDSLDVLVERLSHLVDGVAAALPRGKRPMIYTNADTWTRFMGNTDAFSGHDLWVAQSLDPRTSGLFGGWTQAVLWQFGTTSVPGIAGPVDTDELLVPISRLYL